MHVHSRSPVLALTFFALSSQAASIPGDIDLALVRRDALIIVPDGSVAADWKYVGCLNDSVYARDLAPETYKTDAMTQEICIQHCIAAGYWYAGVEFGRECYCGDLLRTFGGYQSIAQAESQCNQPCAGNAKEKCGGKSLINVFTNGRKATTNPGVNGFTSIGCKYDGGGAGGGRTLTTSANLPAANMTVAACTSACAVANFAFAGVENGKECWCGNTLTQGTTDNSDGPAAQDRCDLPCTGNQSEWCGGPGGLNVYKRPLTLPKPPPLAPGWFSEDCWTDNPNSRTLSKQITLPAASMTIEACISACAQRSYIYTGVEYGQECWCGNTVNPFSSTYRAACDMSCRGNTAETCGGTGSMNLYKYANQSAINQYSNPGFEDGSSSSENAYGGAGNLMTTLEYDSGNALAGHWNGLLYETGYGDSGERGMCFVQYIPHLDSGWYNFTFFIGRTHTPTPPPPYGNQQGEYYDTIKYSVSIGEYNPPGYIDVCSPPSSCPYRPVSGSTNAGYDKVTYFVNTGGYNRKISICGHYYDTRRGQQDGMLLDNITFVGPL